MKISVSVVIPARNAEDTLARALDSVLSQTRPPDEIIVVDDASTDGTAGVARRYRAQGVKLVALPTQRGAAGARNAGIAAARSAWIAFLDADDEWLATKLEKQVALIAADPEIAFVFCASHEFSAAGGALGDTFGGRPVTTSDNAWKALLARNFVATPTVVAPRAALLDLGGFDEWLKVAEDQEMWIKLALTGRPAYVAESLVCVHVQPKSLSSWMLSDQYAYTLPMVERHLARLSGRLTKTEARRIMGERLNSIGLSACGHGDLRHGLPMILRSAFLGYRPLRSLAQLAKAPACAFLKCVLRRPQLRQTAW
jgi:glycosyltransferase involved in cell wall biosynthesis